MDPTTEIVLCAVALGEGAGMLAAVIWILVLKVQARHHGGGMTLAQVRWQCAMHLAEGNALKAIEFLYECDNAHMPGECPLCGAE